MNPRILVVGHIYNNTGIGITLTNLFAKIPKENIAFVSINENFSNQNYNTCFLLGKKEYNYIFPLNWMMKISDSKIISPGNILVANHKKGKKWQFYYKFLNPFLHGIGLYDDRIRYKVSDDLENWIKSYNPDIIYSALGSYSMCCFFKKIMDCFPEKRYAVHLMDDWLHSQANNKLIFRKKYENKLDFVFRSILTRTQIKIVISEKMAKEYSRIYREKFIWFHNPVDTNRFYAENRPSRPGKSIIYIGKINKDNYDVINDLIMALPAINERKNCHLQIYTPTEKTYLNSKLSLNQFVTLHQAVPYETIPTILSQGDLLFLPLSFRKESIRYTRLSISTKLSEYMATGRPLLVYAPENIAITEFVRNNECAFILSEKNPEILAEKIIFILTAQEKDIKSVVNKAVQISREKFDYDRVTSQFSKLWDDELA